MSQALEQFGKYLLLERLASGGMAEVYLSKSTGAVGVNKFVAIKRILPQYNTQQEFIEMFKEEAKIAVNLNHSNVVSIYDFGVEKSQFYLVMEFVDGRNLRQVLNELKKKGTQFTVDQIVFLMKEVSAGLDHAHRCIDGTTGKPLNIVHRDMSPQNIMVSFEGEVKIIDFGIAKAETQLEVTKAGTLKGKYGYMSPEQADGQNIDPRTDIFSIGIVLWELLANDRLFTSNNEAAILRKIRECQIPSIRKINPSVPIELEQIVNKALAKDKNLRYQTASALYRDLNIFLNTQYPEFSSHDFSIFMKNIFSAVFMEQRQKLVEFSKIQGASVEDKTVVTSGHYQAPPPPSMNPHEGATMIDHNRFDDEDSPIGLDTNAKIKVSLDDLNVRKDKSSKTVNTNVSRVGQTNTNIGTRSPYGLKKNTSPNARIKTKGRSTMDSVVGFAMKSVVLFLVAGFGWYGYENFIAGNKPARAIQTQTSPEAIATNTAPPQPEIQTTEMAASVPEYTISIYSSPSGARVILDGQDTGNFTPYRKTLKANTPYSLRLVREGYTDLITTVTPTYEAYSFNGTLQRLPKVGSLIINLVNGGANPELYIGDIPVAIKGRGTAYTVQAEVQVKVKAINRTTGLSAEAVIVVPNDQRKIVDLYLK